MSVITFQCDESNREIIKEKFLKALHEHYSGSVYPNTKVKYEHEGEEVYAARLTELMNNELCQCTIEDESIKFEFDTTEDAGFSIASSVYQTGMGYCDEGLTFLKPLFESIVKALPDVTFEAQCECYDKWNSEEYCCSYDGETFECDAEWMEYEDFEYPEE